MKNLLKGTLVVMLMTIGFSSQSKNMSTGVANTSNAGKMDEATALRLTNRLAEINAIDKHDISHIQKKELRREVRSIKKSMDSGGGVYISVGALIIIILLLIILL